MCKQQPTKFTGAEVTNPIKTYYTADCVLPNSPNIITIIPHLTANNASK